MEDMPDGDEFSEPFDEPKSGLTIVANRLPVTRVNGAWELSPGGLVRALLPVMRAHDATWIGWAGASDASHAGAFEHDGLKLVGMDLSEREYDRYYRHVSNEMLWPLFHDGVRHPEYDSEAWEEYRAVNRRFAEATAERAAENGVVWIHDYHLLLVPGFLRRLRPDVRIGLFVHIPVPPVDLFATLPWRKDVVRSLRCADLVGVQTGTDAGHMRELVIGGMFTEAGQAANGIGVAVEAFPISIDSARYRDGAIRAEEDGSAAAIRRRLAGRRATMMLGIDRLDYTKGIDKRLEALLKLLEEDRLDPGDVCFAQVAVPSRENVAKYQEMSDRIDRLVGRINGLFGGLNGPVVQYVKEGVGERDIVALYRAADVMVVTPLRDGMNLVAKEYLATRFDGTGCLVLSEFAGAAEEFGEAELVNPHDVDAVADALERACAGPRHQQRSPVMCRMHERVLERDVHRWSDRFMGRLGEVGALSGSADDSGH